MRLVGSEIQMTDLRMGFEPAFVFRFVVGELREGRVKAGAEPPRRRRPRRDDLRLVLAPDMGRVAYVAPSGVGAVIRTFHGGGGRLRLRS